MMTDQAFEQRERERQAAEAVGGAVAALVLDQRMERADVRAAYRDAVHRDAAIDPAAPPDPSIVAVYQDAVGVLGLTPEEIAGDVQAVRELAGARAAIAAAERTLSRTRSPDRVRRLRAGLAWYREVLLKQFDLAERGLDAEGERWRIEQDLDRKRRNRVPALIAAHPRVLSGERP